MTRPARTLRRSLAALSLGLTALATPAALPPAQAQAQNSITIVREVDSDRYDPHKLHGARRLRGAVHGRRHARVARPRHGNGQARPRRELDSLARRQDVHLQAARRRLLLRREEADRAKTWSTRLKRWIDPATKSPVRWRAGKVDDIVATDDRHRRVPLDGAVLRAPLPAHPELRRDHRQGQRRGARRRLRRQGLQRHRPLLLGRVEAAQRAPHQEAPGLPLGPADLRQPRPGPDRRGRLEDRA